MWKRRFLIFAPIIAALMLIGGTVEAASWLVINQTMLDLNRSADLVTKIKKKKNKGKKNKKSDSGDHGGDDDHDGANKQGGASPSPADSTTHQTTDPDAIVKNRAAPAPDAIDKLPTFRGTGRGEDRKKGTVKPFTMPDL